MQLMLNRFDITDNCAIGRLSVDGKFICYTLEDGVRVSKIPGITAIPRGNYRVIKNYSYRFKREMLQLVDVPGFTGIRIHAGNTAKDTEGCILVGLTAGDEEIYRSREALKLLEDMLFPLKEGIFIKIT